MPPIIGRITPALTLWMAVWTASASADFVYAARDDGSVTRADVATGVETFFATAGSSATGLAFDGSGNLYVSNAVEGVIWRFTPGGVGSVFASSGSKLPFFGLAFDRAGDLYAANYGANTIDRYTSGGVRSVFASTGLKNPYGLAFDNSGNLFVSNVGDNTIERFTPGGVGSVFANSGLSLPIGLAFDGSGNLLAANAAASTITRFTPGGAGSVFASTNLSSPVGLVFDAIGRLYARNVADNSITRFTPDGVGSAFQSGAAHHAHLLAFQAVPEPSSLLMLGLGGAMAACLAGRRRSQPVDGGRIDSEARATMIARIARKEFTETAPDGRVRLAAGVVTCLSPTSTAVGSMIRSPTLRLPRWLSPIAILLAALASVEARADFTYREITLPGVSSCSIGGANDSGDLVGSYATADGSQHAFAETGGSFSDIAVPGASLTVVTGINNRNGINDAGLAILTGKDADGTPHGFLRQLDGSLVALNLPGAVYTDANAIDSSGRIYGTYQTSDGLLHGYVAQVVPEPSSLLLMAIGIAAGPPRWALALRRAQPGGPRRF